jgi:hypothetical protein
MDLQHCFCEVVNDNIQVNTDIQAYKEENTVMREDILSLQDTLQTLNNVRVTSFVLLFFS